MQDFKVGDRIKYIGNDNSSIYQFGQSYIIQGMTTVTGIIFNDSPLGFSAQEKLVPIINGELILNIKDFEKINEVTE